MPVIGENDYLNFQRNLISESAARLQRQSALEQQQIQRAGQQQAASQAAVSNTETQRMNDAQIQRWGQNFALATKKLNFEADVAKARETYQNELLTLSKERAAFEQQKNEQAMEVHKLELQKMQLQNDMLQVQKNELMNAQTGLLDITKSYEALQTAKQPGEAGTMDAKQVGAAKLALMRSIVTAGPIAREQFQTARGLTEESLFGEELLGVQIESAQSMSAQRRAQTMQLLNPIMAPEKAAEEKARNEWLTGLSDRMVKRYGSMKVAGIGEVAGVDDVRAKKNQFFQTEWKENELIVSAVDVLKQTGAFTGINMNDLIYSSDVLDAKGAATLEGIKQKVRQVEQEKGEAQGEALGAIETLKKRRAQLATKASIFGLVEGLVERREQAINASVEDAYATNRDAPQWASGTESAVKTALEGESSLWREMLNDPDFVTDVERYRNTAAPYSDVWISTAGSITNRLKEKGITDPTMVKYVLSLVRMSNPAYAMTRETMK